MRSTKNLLGGGGGTLGPRWRKVLRDVWQHKSRTILVVLAIAVGILGASPGWTVSHTADFNGDGKVDLLWRNANGAVALWLRALVLGTGGYLATRLRLRFLALLMAAMVALSLWSWVSTLSDPLIGAALAGPAPAQTAAPASTAWWA